MVPSLRTPLERVFVTREGALAAVLAVVASLVCAATPVMSPGVTPVWFAAIAGALVMYRYMFERVVRAGRPVPGLLFAAHVVVCLALVALHPLYGVYAFTGYIDAARVSSGWRQMLGTLAMAGILAFSQVGGLAGRWATWPVYLVFVVINVAIALVMAAVERARERESRERLAAAEDLLRVERENARLQASLADRAREAGILDERARLSREIHDTVAQGLVGIIRQLDAIEAADGERGVRVERARESAVDCLAEARRAVRALASPRLDRDDLPAALERLSESWAGQNDVTAQVVVDGVARPGACDAVLLRVAQEALANVSRHAAATRVGVTLTYLDAPDDVVRLDVRDDGRGFDPGHPADGCGLAGMRHRVNAAGGTCVIEAAPGEGCTVSVEVPMLPMTEARATPDAARARLLTSPEHDRVGVGDDR